MSYKAVLIILYDSHKRFLLQHRSKNAPLLPDYWAFFGGGVNPEETIEEAVYREALEELDYRLKSPKFVWEQNFKVGRFNGRLYVYIEYFGGHKSYLKLREGQGWGWFGAAEIVNLQMIGHDRQLIKSLSQYLENNMHIVLQRQLRS